LIIKNRNKIIKTMVIIKEQTNSYGNQINDWKKEERVKKYIRRCKMRPPHTKNIPKNTKQLAENAAQK